MSLSKNKRNVDDWHLSRDILDETLDAISNHVTVNREYDIPYLAGYSEDGKTIYIDKHIPKFFKTTKNIKVDITRYLVLHEAVEKTLIDKLGLHYQYAHQIALRIEQDAIVADSISWKEYNDFMEKLIKEVADERIENLPKDLDLTPYKDEKDFILLKRMAKSLKEELNVSLIQSLNNCKNI
jgi:hypothetical protein